MEKKGLRYGYHQARWDEPIIYHLSNPGTRGILLPEPHEDIQQKASTILEELPEKMRREDPPPLPELSQKEVLMHFLHLSQETLGANLTEDMSQGTCTMKYNPKVNEELVSHPGFSFLHPHQDESTVQGILEIYYRMEEILKEISGMDRVTLQPGGGSQAIYTAASMMRAYHEEREEKDEIITTIFSHPSNAAAPKIAGFKVITLYSGEDGLPEVEALKAAISPRTAGLFITNPEDVGIFNPKIHEFVRIIHEAGGLSFYDQANANAFLGIARAREVGFDLCHFNLHKTFGTPHGSGGPGSGALCCTEEMAPYLPLPLIDYDGEKYLLDYDRPKSIGKVRDFFGTAGNVLRAYAWSMMLGAKGMREVAEASVVNNNYLYENLGEIKGLDYAFSNNKSRRQEQVRYSWEKLKEDTGVGTEDVMRRVSDFGIQHYFMSHHPWEIPEPMTLEPCESYTKADMDIYIDLFKEISKEAYEDAKRVKDAPHRSAGYKLADYSALSDPDRWALTWSAYLKKRDKIEGEKGS